MGSSQEGKSGVRKYTGKMSLKACPQMRLGTRQWFRIVPNPIGRIICLRE
jgi:hypothetical protein